MVCDPDDWTYISYIRIPLPLWKNWNPAKVLPECLIGILGYFSVYCVYPFTQNYLLSFMYVYAFVVAFVISAYIVFLARTINKIFESSDAVAILVSFCGFLLHFVLFRASAGETSKFLFTASNLNCFMNYIVPTLLSVIVATGFIVIEITDNQKDDIWKIIKNSYNFQTILKVGTVLAILYFTILSNMACNIVFIAPCTYIFLNRIYEKIRQQKVKELISINFIKRNILYIYIFVIELVCLIFEANGGRASSLEVDWKTTFFNTISDLYSVLVKCNRVIVICATIVLVIALMLVFLNRKDKQEAKIRNFFRISWYSLLLVDFYMFFLFARIGDNKIARSENVLTLLVYGIILCTGSIAYILKRFNAVMLAMPLLTVVMYIYAIGGTYEPSISYYEGNTKICLAVNENIIEQFITADKNNIDEIELHIPERGLGNYSFSGERIANTLYKHGIISRRYHPILVLEDISYFGGD